MRHLGRAKHLHNEDGAVAVIFGLCAVLLFVIAGMVVDLGLARATRGESQSAADASALAGADALYLGGPANLAAATTAAENYASTNFNTTAADWTSCTDAGHLAVLATGTQCISFDSATAPSKVRVRMPNRVVKFGLGAISGTSSVSIGTSARAALVPGTAAACSICVIGSGSHSFGNMDVVAATGDIYLDGSISLQPNGHVTASTGTVNLQGPLPSKGTVSTPVQVNQPAMPDPFASLAAPTYATGSFLSTDTTHSNLCNGPGVYANPTATGCTTLPNGLYVIVAGTFSPAGLTVNAGTFYFTCSDAVTAKKGPTTYTPRACNSGESGAGWDLSGNGAATLHAPTTANVSNGDLAGMLFWYDRQNTTGVTLNGNPSLTISGTIYMANAGITYKGSGSVYNSQAQFVVNDLSGNGNPGTLQVTPSSTMEYQVAAGAAALDQ
jgi:Flp pilus assembly protein TadG